MQTAGMTFYCNVWPDPEFKAQAIYVCYGSAADITARSRQNRRRPSVSRHRLSCAAKARQSVEVLVVERQARRAALIAAMSIFFMPIIASNARFASSPPAASASVSTRGVICRRRPTCLCTSRTGSPGRHCRRWRSGQAGTLLVLADINRNEIGPGKELSRPCKPPPLH